MKGRFVKFLLVGSANTAFCYGLIFFSMYAVGLSPELSNAFGYAVGLATSFLLHGKFTFANEWQADAKWVRFMLVFAVAYAMNFVALILLIDNLELPAALAQCIAGAVYVVISYTLNRDYVFRRRSV